MFYDDEDPNGNVNGTEESNENDSDNEELSGDGGGTSEDNVGSDNEQSGGGTQNPTWSWDSTNHKVVYGETGEASICEISGFGEEETSSLNFSGLTVDQANSTITVSEEFLSHLTKDATLSASGDYRLVGTDKEATLVNASASAAGSVDGNGKLTIKGQKSAEYTFRGGEIEFKAKKDVELAIVSGLSANASSGFDVSGSSDIVLETAALGNSDVSISYTSNNTGSNKISFTFKLKSGDGNTLNKLGFSDNGNTWTVNDTSATYQQKRNDGWEVKGDTVKYYAADGNTVDLATITGLKSGLKSGNTIEGITVTSTPEGDDPPTTTTFKLAQSVLGTEEVSVAKASGNTDITINYALGLTGDSDGKLGFTNSGKTWTFNNGTATYGYSTAEGWTLSGDSTKITHTEAVPHTLLTLTGLSSGFGDSLAIVEPGDNGAPAKGTVTLVENAFNTTAENPTISISGGSDSTKYDLSVGTLTSALTLDGDPQIKVNTTDGVKLTGKTQAYYEVASDKNSVTYHAANENYTLATIEGAASTANADAFSITSGSTVVTVKKAALDGSGITITNTDNKPTNYADYTLALDTVEGNDILKEANHVDTNAEITYANSKITGKTLGYYTAESGSIVWHEPTDAELATIEGLGNSATASDVTFDVASKTVKISKTALENMADNSTITLTQSSESYVYGTDNNAKLKIAFAENSDKTKIGYETVNTWAVTDGTATYATQTAKGWFITGTKIIQEPAKPATPKILITVTGLKDEVKAGTGENAGKLGTGSGESFKVNANIISINDDKTVTIDTSYLKTEATVNVSSTDYTFKLKDDNDNGNKVGMTQSSCYWTVTGSKGNYTATYQYDVDEGWTLEGGEIKYTDAITKSLFSISGLKLNDEKFGTLAAGETAKYSSLEGITAPDANATGEDANTFKLADSVLGNREIKLTNGTDAGDTDYKLGFSGTTTTIGDATVHGFENNNGNTKKWFASDSTEAGKFVYGYTTEQGWTLDNDGKTIKYKEAVDTPLATLEGFKPTIKNVTDLQNAITTTPDASNKNKGTITLKADALPTNLKDSETTITLKNEEDAQYTLALDNGISNITGKSTTTALDFSNSEQGRVKLKETLAAGWVKSESSAASEGQGDAAEGETTPAVNKVETFTYKAAVDITHIELSGLNPDKENTAKANITFEGNTVYLDKGALTNQDVKVKVNDNDNDNDTEPTTYTVKLKGSVGTFGFEADGYGWELYTENDTEDGTEESDTQTAGKTYQYYPKQKEGWTTYVGEESEGDDNVKPVVKYIAAGIKHDTPIAKISGLADNLVTGGTIADSLVSVTNSTNKYTFTISADAIEKVAGNVVKVNAATETSDDSENSEGTTSTPTYTLELHLKDANADGEVGFAKGTPYLVAAVADDDSEADVLADDDELDTYTVTYQRDIGEGWRLNNEYNKIVYFGASADRPADDSEEAQKDDYNPEYYSYPEELIHITGLNKNVLDKGNVTGISTSDGKTFTISPDIVNKNVGVVVLEVDKENSETGYKLALEGANADGKVGFKKKAPHYLVTKDSDEYDGDSELATYTVTYEFDVEEGWTIKDGKITYTSATDAVNEDDDNEGEDEDEESKNRATVLVTISGLKAPKGTKLDTDKSDDSEDIDGKKFSALEGISYDDTTKTFTIDESLLGASDITLKKGTGAATSDTYKLAIKDAIDGKFGFEDSENYWVINEANGTATFQHDVTEGWTLNKDAKTIEYSPARTQPGEDEYTDETDETAPIVIATLKGINYKLSSKPLPTEGNDDENFDASDDEVYDTDKYIDDCISYDADTSTFTVTDMELFDPDDNGKLELVSNNNAVKLALGDDIATAASVYYNAEETEDGEEGNKNPKLTVGSGDATITGTLNPYVKLASNAKSIDYTAQKKDITLATVSGLGYGATDGEEGNITLNGNIITLKDGSLDKNKIVKAQITVNDSALKAAGVPEADLPAYTFALDSGVDSGVLQTPKVFDPETESFTVSKVDKGTATIQGDTQAYYSLSDDGKSVSYNESAKLTVAEVTGLKSAATTANIKITGDKTNGYTVSISKDALDKSDIAFVSKKALAPFLSDSESENKFKFSLAIDGVTTTDEDGTATYSLASTPVGWTVSNGVATYKETAGESWTLSSDASAITYTAPVTNEVVTIKGLDSKLKTMPDGITVDTSERKISIAPAALKTLSKNELTFVTDGYELQFTDGNTTSGFGEGDNTWVVSNGTATYQQAIGEGYTISGNKLTYSPATAKTLFKISGLSGIANGTYESIDGVKIEPDGKTITLSEKVLGNSSVTLTRSENDYKLEIDGADNGKLGGEEAEEASWVIYKDGTAKYQKVTSATYQVNENGDIISYTPAKEYDTATVYATLKGLDSSITVDQLETSNLIETSEYTLESDKVKTKGTMTIHAGALGTGTVTLESDYYNLALGTDVAKETDYVTKQWTSNKKGTATYTQNTAAHYEQDGNSVKYVKASSTTLATVSGLKTGLEAESNDDRPASIEGIFVSGNKILVSDAALGTTTAKLTLPKNAENMTLAYIGSATEEAATAATGANWLVSGGTATLKELKPAYYKANEAGTQITYTGAAAVKENKKEVVYAVIKGVSKTADKNDFVVTTKYKADTDGKVTEKGVITLTADALNKADITLNKDYRKYYTLALAKDNLTDADDTVVKAEAIAEPQVDNATWSLSKTTATYKGNISEGYTASSDGNTITYTKAQNSATLLTISGIPSGVSVKNDKLYVTDSKGDSVEAVTITDDRKVIVSEAALALTPTKLTLKGTGYEFAFPPTSSTASSAAAETDSDDTIDSYTNILTSDSDVVKNGIDVWRVSGTTATYKKVIPAHYEIDSKGALVYKKEQDHTFKDGKTTKKTVYATITGLAKGLHVNDEGKVVNSDGKEVVSLNGTNVEVKASALGNKTVKLTPGATGNYMLTTNATTPQSRDAYWLYGGSTATLKKGSTAGYEVGTDKSGNPTITYKKASGSTLATVTGLKKGLTLKADNSGVEGINFDGTTITLEKDALGTSNIKLNNAKGQSFKLDAEDATDGKIASKDDQIAYSYSGSTFKVNQGKSAAWTLKGNNLNISTKAKMKTIVTVTGLKKGLTQKADGTINGIEVSGNKITLSKDVLGTGTVKVTGGTLELSGDVPVKNDKPDDTYTWAVSGNKITLKKTEAGYYTYTKSGNTLKYTKPKTINVATVTGVKKGLKVTVDAEGNGTIDGIIYDSEGKTITLDNRVLDYKDVSVSGTGSYTLVLGTGVNISEGTGSVWSVSGTTATLKQANTEGYRLENVKIKYYTGTKGTTVLTTVSGLKKGLKVNSDGTINGIIYDSEKNTITLSKDVLGTTNVTSSKYALEMDGSVTKSEDGYKLEVDKNGDIKVYSEYTTAGFSEGNGNKLTYTKSSGGKDLVATISGLKSGLKATDGQIDGIEVNDSEENTITLGKDVLDGKDVSIKNEEGSEFALGLAENVSRATPKDPVWSAPDATTAVYSADSTGGYSVAEGSNSITYTDNGGTKVVISGLSGVTADKAESDINVSGNTFTVPASLIGNTTVSISGDNKLAVSGTPTPAWQVSGTTATLVQTASKDQYLCDGATITKVTADGGASKVLATITGLPENFSANDLNEPTEDGVITLPVAAFTDNTSDIKLTGTGYTLSLVENRTTTITDATTATWSVASVAADAKKKTPASTTATLATGKTAGYTLSDDGKTLTYSDFVPADKATLATITGLKEGLTLSDVSGWKTNSKEITLTKDMLGSTNVEVSKGYTLALDKDVPQAATAVESTETYSGSGSNITINTTAGIYYKPNTNKTKIEVQGGATTVLGKLSGLPKDTALNGAGTVTGVSLDKINKTINLTVDMLGTGTIALTSTEYTLTLPNGAEEPNHDDYAWTISKGKATLKETLTTGYTLEDKGKSIKYNKEATVDVATLEGLKTSLKAEDGEIEGVDIDENNGVIIVSEEALSNGNVTLKMGKGVEAGTYTLALDSDVPTADSEDVQTGEDVWSTSGTTATLKHVTPAYYTLDGNTIKYTAAKEDATLATVSNVVKFDAEDMFDAETKTITLSEDNLDGKTVTVKGTGYKLALDSVSEPEFDSADWSKSGTTATLNGTRTAGYTLSSDEQTVTYSASKSDKLAVISGTTDDFDGDVDTYSEKVTLSGLSNKVTVSGSFELDFDSNFKGSITGSANAEKIAVGGTEVTVSAGAGNDYIDLGTKGGNTVVYSGGNDSIANFTATGTNKDTLQLSGSVSVSSAAYDDGDVILTLSNKNTITLENFGEDSINYLDSKGESKSISVAAADLMTSDNFIGADSDLGAITDSGAYKLGDFNATALANDYTELTKQSSPLTFGNKK